MMAKSRRGNGEGSIYQRSNGQWCATYAAGYDADGKRRRRTIFAKTKEEILEQLAKKQSQKLAGAINDPARLRLGAFLDRWLEDAARPTIRATTYESYKGIIKNHLKPHVGGLLLGKLGPAHVQGLYSEMERGGASSRTRQLTHAVLRKAMKQAVRWRLIPINPCDAVDPPRVARSEIHPLDTDQVAALLAAAAGDRIEGLYVVAIGGGLRLGELFGLQWNDIVSRRLKPASDRRVKIGHFEKGWVRRRGLLVSGVSPGRKEASDAESAQDGESAVDFIASCARAISA